MELRYYIAKCNLTSNGLRRKCIRLRPKSGQTLVEYALIIAFISVVAIGSLLAMGGQVSGTYTTIEQQLNAANTGGPVSVSRGH